MIVSLNWLKKLTDVKVSNEELITLIGARLVEIEKVIDLSKKYEKALIVKAVSVDKITTSDHLSLVKIDDGRAVDSVKRDEKGLIQVVCGAPNVKSGQMVVWLPPSAIVPSTFGTAKQITLEVRSLNGFESSGMIASASELDISDDHNGILEIKKSGVEVGESLIKALELDDLLLDIENKSLTHRPDTFGVMGFAREVSAIQNIKFKTPDWFLRTKSDFTPDSQLKIDNVTVEYKELCERYQAVVLSGVDNHQQSPLLVQTYLSRVGIRPISAIVDITNYLMLLTGQPLHAFDYDKLVSVGGGKADICVRSGKVGEKLELLDKKIIELTPDDIVIAAGDTAIGLAGAMGGLNTAIDENTKNIVIESATFNLYKLRGTQMRHGIFSEAITRFTKGQPSGLTMPTILKAIDLAKDWINVKAASDIYEVRQKETQPIVVKNTTKKINDILGANFSEVEIINTLENAEFIVTHSNNELEITVPWWRKDVSIAEDIVEEIGRLKGFDNIQPTLPLRDFVAIKPSDFDSFRNKIRTVLARAGANEILTYNFIHGDVIKKVGQDVNNSYKIVNSISPRLQYCRQDLTPSLLDLIHPNIKQGYDRFALFELNKTHQKADGLNNEGVPVEKNMLALVVTNKNTQVDSAYYQAKRILEYLCQQLHFMVEYSPIDEVTPETTPFETQRSALIFAKNGEKLGVIGEYRKLVQKNFKLPEQTAGFELDLSKMFNVVKNTTTEYQPLSRYPVIERDICFKADKSYPYAQLLQALETTLKDEKITYEISPIDIYQMAEATTKNITVHIKLNDRSRTLTSDDANNIIKSLTEKVTKSTNTTVI